MDEGIAAKDAGQTIEELKKAIERLKRDDFFDFDFDAFNNEYES